MNDRSEKFEKYLDELYENAVCELNYQKDYELLIAVVMSAQTTDKRVNLVTPILFNKYKDLKSLATADINDIMDIIKPIGTFHKKAVFIKEIARILDTEMNGKVPNDRAFLEKLPGVGRKTNNVVLSILYQEPCIAVDTHVERVSKRLGFAKENDSVLTVEKKLMRLFSKKVWSKRHHQMVFFGRYNCQAQRPTCLSCKLKEICPYYQKNIKKKTAN